jgi:hypothetical protein
MNIKINSMYPISYYHNSNSNWSKSETDYLRVLYICHKPSIKELAIQFRRTPQKIIEKLKQMELMQ